MATASTRLGTPYGSRELLRYPRRSEESLRAWCAADTQLIEACHALNIHAQSTLVVNDDHGALCTSIGPAALWTDSKLAQIALQENLQRNQLVSIQTLWSSKPLTQPYLLAVLRIPKQLPYLEYQLTELARAMPQGSNLLAAGMDKHLSARTAEIIERTFGPTQRHRGRQKARLFAATRGPHPAPARSTQSRYYCEELGGELQSGANGFSREKLDMGTRFLLQHLEKLAPVEHCIDLACGNGVLGLTALHKNVCQRLLLCDESAMAIDAARANAQALLPLQQDLIEFHHGDGLRDIQDRADLILCNPPFHLGHTVDDFVGRRLLAQCQGQLQSGGKLCLVANRHLDYRSTLKHHFSSVDILAQNQKFIIWLASRG